VHRAIIRRYAKVGYRELAREWRVKADWEMKELKAVQDCSGTERYCVGQRVGQRWGRDFRRDMLSSCSRLVIVELTRSRQGQVILDIHTGFTWFVWVQKTDQETSALPRGNVTPIQIPGPPITYPNGMGLIRS
jgi:hypothetical protein